MTVSSGPHAGEKRAVSKDEDGTEYVMMGHATPRKTPVTKLSESATKEVLHNKKVLAGELPNLVADSLKASLDKHAACIREAMLKNSNPNDIPLSSLSISDEFKAAVDEEGEKSDEEGSIDTVDTPPTPPYLDENNFIEVFPGAYVPIPPPGEDIGKQEILYLGKD